MCIVGGPEPSFSAQLEAYVLHESMGGSRACDLRQNLPKLGEKAGFKRQTWACHWWTEPACLRFLHSADASRILEGTQCAQNFGEMFDLPVGGLGSFLGGRHVYSVCVWSDVCESFQIGLQLVLLGLLALL